MIRTLMITSPCARCKYPANKPQVLRAPRTPLFRERSVQGDPKNGYPILFLG